MVDVSGLLLWLVGTAVFFAVLFLVIRAAVRGGLRDHQEWLDERAAAKDSIHTE
jgi:hypothetical protein